VSDSFMDRIKARIAAHGTTRRPTGPVVKSRQNVTHNRLDRRRWDAARQQDVIDDAVGELMVGDLNPDLAADATRRQPYDNGPELLQDLYYSLYKADPAFVDKREVETDARLNRQILESIKEVPEFNELREMTVADETLSTMALLQLTEAVKEVLVRSQEAVEESNRQRRGEPQEGGSPGGEPNPDGEPDPNGQPEPGQPGGDDGDGGGPDGDSEPSDGGDGDGDAPEGGGGDDEQESSDGDGEFDPNGAGDPDADEHDDPAIDQNMIERIMAKAVAAAADDAQELDTLRRNIGLEDGEWRAMSPEARMAMAERLQSPQLKAAAEMFGRMKRMALGARATRVVDVPHEIFDVTTGDNIRDMLGSEFALLDEPSTELEFYRRFLERESLVYAKRGTEEAGKGPVVVAIDKSGSMHGDPFTWAMGVAEALRRLCAEDDRDYYAIFFGSHRYSNDTGEYEDDLDRFSFPKGRAPFEKVLEFMSCEPNGGTDFKPVLTESLARIRDAHDASGLRNADIIFITDGQAHLDEEWLKGFNEEKARIGARVFGIFVGGARDYYGGSSATATLESFSDAVIAVSELTPAAVKDVFAAV